MGSCYSAAYTMRLKAKRFTVMLAAAICQSVDVGLCVCRRVYIVRSLPLLTRYIADQINAERSAGITQKSYTILFVPRKVRVITS